MIAKLCRAIVWIVLISLGAHFAPAVIRMDHDQRIFFAALVGVVLLFGFVSRWVTATRHDDDDPDAELLWRRNAENFRE